MPDFLKYFDGSDRQPRQVQVTALTWLSDNWAKHRVFCMSAPTASGKSSIAEAVALATGAHIITPTNILIDQYIDTFPTRNFLKGKEHYTCSPQMTCHEWIDECEQPACDRCPYMKSKMTAYQEPTFFNPMSYWYHTQTKDFVPPKVLVVDEAHSLISSLMMLCGVRLRYSEYRFPKQCNDELTLADWLDSTCVKLSKLRTLAKDDKKKYAAISKEIGQLKMTSAGIRENPQNFAIWTESAKYRGRAETYLNIKPLQIPRYIRQRFFQADKVVLLSGTILDADVKELLGPTTEFAFLDLPSPIDVKRRQVNYRPVNFKLNYQTDPSELAAAIERIIDLDPTANTIIHVSYAMSNKLAPFFTRPIIVNTSDDKDEKLAEFKKNGGIFLAAGCAEGIDLKGDLARVNIIPKLLFPDLNNMVVKKRKALADGEEWYGLQTLKTCIQQAGRTTRTPTDSSAIYVLDPSFSRLYSRWKHKLPGYFKDAIKWST